MLIEQLNYVLLEIEVNRMRTVEETRERKAEDTDLWAVYSSRFVSKKKAITDLLTDLQDKIIYQEGRLHPEGNDVEVAIVSAERDLGELLKRQQHVLTKEDVSKHLLTTARIDTWWDDDSSPCTLGAIELVVNKFGEPERRARDIIRLVNDVYMNHYSRSSALTHC